MERMRASISQTVQRVQGRGLVIQPPKSAKGRRSISLDPETVGLLRTHRVSQLENKLRIGEAYRDKDLVFAGSQGNPLEPSALTKSFIRLVKDAGARHVRLHDLRHFHATLMLQEGIHPKVVQERLGHSTISVTLDTYSHVIPGLQEQAAMTFANAMDSAERNATG